MRTLFFSIAMIGAFTCLKAQVKRDTSNTSLAPNTYMTDSVKRGNEVYNGTRHHQNDTTGTKPKKKSNPPQKESRKPE